MRIKRMKLIKTLRTQYHFRERNVRDYSITVILFVNINLLLKLWLCTDNRSLALRGHVTNASFKQWVGILLMPKSDRAHRNYRTPEIWEETHLRETFYDTLIFQQGSMICIGRHVGGQLLPFNMYTTFHLYPGKRLIVTLRCAANVTTSSFQHFPWSLSAKFVFRRR